jgi:hypothetical protein
MRRDVLRAALEEDVIRIPSDDRVNEMLRKPEAAH